MIDFFPAYRFGVDLASWQQRPNWGLVSRHHDFMVTKVTGEGNYVNPYWYDNHELAERDGIIPGTYDWVEPQMWVESWGETAAHQYLDTIGNRNAKNLLCVDFETPEWYTGPMGRNIEPFMRRYLYTLKERSRKPVIVYTGDYFLKETGANRWEWLGKDFLLWLAAPGNGMLPDDAPYPAAVAPWVVPPFIHQHQWHATGNGFAGEFDRNRTRVTLQDLLSVAVENGGNEVREPEPEKYTAYINANGNTIFVWNMGGQTDEILGLDIKDIGMTVASKTVPGIQVSASIQNQKVTGFTESPRKQ